MHTAFFDNPEVLERQSVLQAQLQVGEHLSEQEKKSIQNTPLLFSDVFALRDEELGRREGQTGGQTW